MPDNAPAKICVICGEDCSGRPRQKDKDGRYACGRCLDARTSGRRPAPATTPQAGDGDLPYDVEPAEPKRRPPPKTGGPAGKPPRTGGVDPALADLLADTPALGGAEASGPKEGCPSCGRLMSKDQVICTNCGFNRAKGSKVKTKVTELKEPKEESTSSGAGIIIGPLALAGLMIIPIGALAGLAFIAPQPAVGLALGWSVVMYILMVYAAFQDGDGLWGILGAIGVLGGCTSTIFAIYYCIFGSDRTVWKIVYWASNIAFLVTALVVGVTSPSVLDELPGMGSGNP